MTNLLYKKQTFTLTASWPKKGAKIRKMLYPIFCPPVAETGFISFKIKNCYNKNGVRFLLSLKTSKKNLHSQFITDKRVMAL